MEIKKKYLQKYLHEIAIEQIAEEYSTKGYSISKEENVGKYRADIVARKNKETIVIEVKSGKMTPAKKEIITGIGNYVRSHENYQFLVVIATPPIEKKLEVANIEEILTNLMLDNLPDELDELSSHTRIDGVTDVEIDTIAVEGSLIDVAGNGNVSVELQYGSDSDQGKGDGVKVNENFLFDFKINLEYDDKSRLQIHDVGKLQVNTSHFYE